MTVSKAKVSADAMGIASTSKKAKKTTLNRLLAWWRRRYFMRVPAAIVLFAHQTVRPVSAITSKYQPILHCISIPVTLLY
jgi:hypothetical protein